MGGNERPNITASPRLAPAKEQGGMHSPKLRGKKRGRMRTHRYTSNVFSMFNQAQIQEFKEAFNMIDQNRDGFVDKDDLIEMLTSLGKNPTDRYIDDMISDAPGPLNFTMFLTLFGEKLQGTDPEDVIKNAFACFDPKATGKLTEEHLRDIMTTMGDRWTDEMVDELFYGAPIYGGLFDYIDFTRTLKHGAKEKDEEQTTVSLESSAEQTAEMPPSPIEPAPPATTMAPPSTKVAPPATTMAPPSTKVAPPATNMAPSSTKLAVPATKITPPAMKPAKPAKKMAPPATKLATPALKSAPPATTLATPDTKMESTAPKLAASATKMVPPNKKVGPPVAKKTPR